MRTLLVIALLAASALAPIAAADVTVPVYVCKVDPIDGMTYCDCHETTFEAKVKAELSC